MLIAILALSGCGASGGGTPPAASGSTPVASAGTGSGAFDPQLAAQSSQASSASAQSLAAASGAAARSASSSAAKSHAPKTSQTHTTAHLTKPTTTTHTTSTPLTSTTPKQTSTTPTVKTPAKSSSPKTSAPPRIVTRTVTKKVYVTRYVTRYRTRYKTQTKYETTTVTQAPDVPAGAFLPSKHAALSQTSFTVPGGTIACVIGGGSVRCDVNSPTWTAPAQPSSCTASWGDAIVLTNSTNARPAQFACGGTSALSASASTVSYGYDDSVGAITCQIRPFGVNCFAADNQGFILSQTGYLLY